MRAVEKSNNKWNKFFAFHDEILHSLHMWIDHPEYLFDDRVELVSSSNILIADQILWKSLCQKRWTKEANMFFPI